jgi:DNA-directed RNA polymerase subunit RPC12/RpoP
VFFFIIGFGKTTEDDFGSLGIRLCPHCGNRREWRHLRVKTWLTLFFIPVFPYKTEELTRCPICGYTAEV